MLLPENHLGLYERISHCVTSGKALEKGLLEHMFGKRGVFCLPLAPST